jgi:predicted DNA-binding transcriptional regulator AlpA
MSDDKNSAAIDTVLRNWPNLPDEAFIRPRTVAALIGCHEDTVWRRSRQGTLPPIKRLGPRVSGMQVGALRKALALFAETTVAHAEAAARV